MGPFLTSTVFFKGLGSDRSGFLNGNLFRMAIDLLGKGDAEHTIFVTGLDIFLVNPPWECEGALEGSERSLNLKVTGIGGFLDKFPLPLNDQGILFHLNFDLILIHLREVDFQDDLIPFFHNVDRWGPNSPRNLLFPNSGKGLIEEPGHPVLHGHQVSKRFPLHMNHTNHLQWDTDKI